jgi:hypothetical protein
MTYYASGATMTRLPIGSANQIMVSNGTVPAWSSSLTLVTAGLTSSVTGTTTVSEIKATDTTGNPVLINFYTDTGSLRGSISYNRGSGQIAYNVTSDERLKECIQDAESALDKIEAIKVRSYQWIDSKAKVAHGLIAQELHKVAEEAVKVGDEAQQWMIDTSALIPALIKAVQELSDKVKKLSGEDR